MQDFSIPNLHCLSDQVSPSIYWGKQSFSLDDKDGCKHMPLDDKDQEEEEIDLWFSGHCSLGLNFSLTYNGALSIFIPPVSAF